MPDQIGARAEVLAVLVVAVQAAAERQQQVFAQGDLVLGEDGRRVALQRGPGDDVAVIVDRHRADGVGVGQLFLAVLGAEGELVQPDEILLEIPQAVDDPLLELAGTAVLPHRLVLEGVAIDVQARLAEGPFALVAGAEVGAFGFRAEGPLRRQFAVAVRHEQLGRQGLLHPVVGFEREVVVLDGRPVQHAVQALVDDAARAVGAGEVHFVGIGAGVGRAQAQAQVLRERTGHVDAQLIGVAALGILGPSVAGVGRSAPRRGDLAGDDVDDAAHGVGAVERRHRPAHHFDALDHVGRDPV